MKRLILLAAVLSVGVAVAGWRGRFDEQFAAAASSTARLPAEYQAVEYLESTGTQYIDTGYKLGYNSSVELRYLPLTVDTQSLFGGRIAAPANRTFSVHLITSGSANRYDFSGVAYSTRPYPNHEGIPMVLQMSKVEARLNGVVYVKIANTSPEPFTGAYSAYLFACNTAGSATLPATFKAYHFKIWESNTPVRDLVPCVRKSDSVAGMYDLVSKQFFTNQGTGEFIVGPNIED